MFQLCYTNDNKVERQLTHTKKSIIALLATNDHAVERAILALRARQTSDEVRAERTKYKNDRGFNAPDARIGTSMAADIDRFGNLTGPQVALWRVRSKATGKMRIEKYAGQLLRIARAREAAKLAATQRSSDKVV